VDGWRGGVFTVLHRPARGLEREFYGRFLKPEVTSSSLDATWAAISSRSSEQATE